MFTAFEIAETALPGGKIDDSDASIDAAALREAFEEVGLDHNNIPLLFLTAMPPILSRNLLFVFPLVFFLAAPRPSLTLRRLKPNPDEVSSIFDAPLDSFLLLNREIKVEHSFTDVPSFMSLPYRLHHFDHPTFSSPVTGMTAEVLVRVALVAFGKTEPPFTLLAEGGRPSSELVEQLAQQHRDQGLLA